MCRIPFDLYSLSRIYLGNQLVFTGYILQNGLVLKSMKIGDFFIDSLDQLEEWLKKTSDI
jgi:hypothetical protein